MMSEVSNGVSIKDMVVFLIDIAKMDPITISEAMDNRVSSRTIYRWARGESEPQNSRDVEVLHRLYAERKVS